MVSVQVKKSILTTNCVSVSGRKRQFEKDLRHHILQTIYSVYLIYFINIMVCIGDSVFIKAEIKLKFC